jgi:hypothetical protein
MATPRFDRTRAASWRAVFVAAESAPRTALAILAPPLPLIALLCASCGSRSEIFGLGSDAGRATVDAAPEAALPPGSCTTDSDCATGAYCLVGTCDGDGGCASNARDCDDGISCTRDTCSETAKSCVHTPDDSLCPDTELCSPRRDCDAFVYGVGSDNHLYETRVPSGQVALDVGFPAATITDVALTGASVLYAIDSYNLYRVDRATAANTLVAAILPLYEYNGLGAAADGSLLATASDAFDLFRVDPVTGLSTPIAAIPANYQSGGDVTTWTTRVLVPINLVDDPTLASLASYDAATLQSVVVGAWTDRCLYGIATLGGVVYELDCMGSIYTVDPQTGAASLVGQSTVRYLGAAGR